MVRRPPRSTRTDTLFPYTTLFRSQPCWKPAHRLGRPALVAEIVKTRRCGWYYRVLEPGVVVAGDVLKLEARPYPDWTVRSEEHTSELQSLMRISYAVFCLKKKNKEIELTRT